MRIFLTGMSGGIGSAIAERLYGHEVVSVVNTEIGGFDWLIFAHGVIGEENPMYTFSVNTLLCIEYVERLLPRLKEDGGIIFLSSTSGIKGNTKYPIYSASKAALNSYAETLARLKPKLQVHALCPGPTDTKMWRSLGLKGKAQPPERVADVVIDIIGGLHRSSVIITVRDSTVDYV